VVLTRFAINFHDGSQYFDRDFSYLVFRALVVNIEHNNSKTLGLFEEIIAQHTLGKLGIQCVLQHLGLSNEVVVRGPARLHENENLWVRLTQDVQVGKTITFEAELYVSCGDKEISFQKKTRSLWTKPALWKK
jgi:hypothetical protein